jgi:hypothetical protein
MALGRIRRVARRRKAYLGDQAAVVARAAPSCLAGRKWRQGEKGRAKPEGYLAGEITAGGGKQAMNQRSL